MITVVNEGKRAHSVAKNRGGATALRTVNVDRQFMRHRTPGTTEGMGRRRNKMTITSK